VKGQKVDGEKRKKNLSQILVCLVYVATLGQKSFRDTFYKNLNFGACANPPPLAIRAKFGM